MAFSDELIVSFSGDGAFELFTMRLYSTYCKKVPPTWPSMPIYGVTRPDDGHAGGRSWVIKFHGWRQHAKPPASWPMFSG